MRYTTMINNIKAIEWDLDIKEAYLFSWFYELPSWAEKVIIGNNVYYHASKNKAVLELPILTDKIDTMYRFYKKVESKGLILIKKIDGKDYVAITELGKKWNHYQEKGHESERSDKNPNEVGQKSESGSDKNPTNNIYNKHSFTSNKEKDDLFQGLEKLMDLPNVVLDYLNDKKPSKRGFESTNPNLSHIKARIKEKKYSLQDFKNVVDLKVSEWKDDTKMKQYIRPSTLFGEKFNEYLIQFENKGIKNDGSNNFVLNPSEKADLK